MRCFSLIALLVLSSKTDASTTECNDGSGTGCDSTCAAAGENCKVTVDAWPSKSYTCSGYDSDSAGYAGCSVDGNDATYVESWAGSLHHEEGE